MQCMVTESVASGVGVHAITIVKKLSNFKKESSYIECCSLYSSLIEDNFMLFKEPMGQPPLCVAGVEGEPAVNEISRAHD